MLTRRKKPQRFNSRVAFAVSGGLLLYWQQTPRPQGDGGEGEAPHPGVSTLSLSALMRKLPGRHIAIAVAGSPEVEVCPVDLGLGCAGGIEGGAGVAVQEHVIPSWLAGLYWGRLRHGAATASGARQQSGTALAVPEQIGAWRRRVLLDPVLPKTEQSRRRQRPRVERLIERLRQRAGLSTQAEPWISSS